MTPWTTACQASLSITNFHSPPKLMSIELVMPSNHFILCRPLLLLPSIFPSIRVFSSDSPLHIRWPKYWSFSFNISPSSEHPWLISFRMDWLDLLAVPGTLKSLLQHHSSKASILSASLCLLVGAFNPFTFKVITDEWIQKQDPYICCLQETHLKTGDTYRLKVKGWKKIFHAHRDQKKAGVAILISDKIDFKTKTVKRDKDGHYIMIKGSIQEEDITIINIFFLLIISVKKINII